VVWVEIFNKAENLIRDELTCYLSNQVDVLYAKGLEWSDLLQDNLVQVVREFTFRYDRVPFFLVKMNMAERIVGLGDIPFLSEGLRVEWNIAVDDGFIDVGDNEFKVVRKTGCTEVYRLPSSVFPDFAHVPVQAFVQVMRDLMSSDWIIYYDEDASKIVLILKDNKVVVQNGSLFGIEPGVYVNADVFRSGFMLDGSLVIGVGAQSAGSRAQMKDLVVIWLAQKRARNNAGILASKDGVSVLIGGLWTVADMETSIGAGDMLKMLYMSSVTIPVIVEVQGPMEELTEVQQLVLDNMIVQ